MSVFKPVFKNHPTNPLPAVLWHGSAYATDILKPGFLWSKKHVEWDSGESNHYLYATTERESAIALGFGSAIEKRHLLDRFQVDEKTKTLVIFSPRKLTHYDLEQLQVWLYELHPQNSEQWVYNHNQTNKIDTEYKTHRIVPFARREQIDLKIWLGQWDVEIKRT